ncbi:GNAT family N-acetyltransferase [Clostridium pasteurianum]|uniref:Acetyltransferase, ribosomal protein N-acetylase n=1 Tax=Clostridium pasteurianum BC1 TaxID=86416 RepID=R4K9W0_CLOPA|nr:GNAT family protein [Clostridium pasteurianum]AGK99358.1 acetyltransferase, ribosomal protein N-acetylase [Clostridium pasteurianum BC1]
MYTGKKVRLKEYRKEDVKLVQSYVNDSEIKKLLNPGIPYLYTFEDEEKWFESLSAKNDQYSFAIETLVDNKYIGGCGINSIDWKNSAAVIGIFIGDKEYWGKGYGTDAMKLLISFIFEQMNLNKIKLQVLSYNERAIKCYEKCGFTKEGVLREEIFRDGKYHDNIVMGFFKIEYYKEMNKSVN